MDIMNEFIMVDRNQAILCVLRYVYLHLLLNAEKDLANHITLCNFSSIVA